MPARDVLIVGAGPSGLATAIACRHHGLDYQVLEQGALVDAIARFPINMVFFTTPELLEIGGVPLTTPYEKPTRAEALRYYRKVTDMFQLQVSLHEQVLAVEPDGHGDERLFAVATRSRLGVERVRHARAVVLAMGYYGLPNLLGVPGEHLPHVSHYYSEPHPYYRQRVVIVGGKNSACEAALELYRNGAHVTMVHRGETLGDSVKYWVRPDIDNRIKEGTIAARFATRVVEIRPTEVVVEIGQWPRDDCRRQRPAPDRLPRRPGVPARHRHRGRRRHAGAALRRRHVRDQRGQRLHRRRPAGGDADRHDLHRERATARRTHRPGAGRAPARLIGDWAWPRPSPPGRKWRGPLTMCGCGRRPHRSRSRLAPPATRFAARRRR